MKTDNGAKSPAKLTLLDLLALGVFGALLRLAASAAMRAWAIRAHPGAAWGLTLASLALALFLVWQLLRIWRRRDSWVLYLGAALLFVLLYKAGNNRPEIAPIELPLAILMLLPAGLLVWAFVRQVRQADELERRILFQALALAFVVEFAAAIGYAFLEGLDAPRPPSIMWAALLVMSWAAGLGIFSRRYE